MRYTLQDLGKLLFAIDKELKGKAPLIIIDIPTYSLTYFPIAGMEQVPDDVVDQLRRAHGTATARTGIAIPFVSAQDTDFPFGFESRLTPIAVQGLQKVQVRMADRHDAVIAKLMKNNEREIASITNLPHKAGLTFEALLDRFCSIDPGNCDFRRTRAQFLSFIETLFGQTSVTLAEAAIAERLG